MAIWSLHRQRDISTSLLGEAFGVIDSLRSRFPRRSLHVSQLTHGVSFYKIENPSFFVSFQKKFLHPPHIRIFYLIIRKKCWHEEYNAGEKRKIQNRLRFFSISRNYSRAFACFFILPPHPFHVFSFFIC